MRRSPASCPRSSRFESTAFPLPMRDDLGDFGSGQLLREAARLSTRAAAGPFRSFGRIAAEPRPYQLVPLMMALRLDPVRLLIADDVGIGKTIEAAVIARELLDRGEIRRLAVLCPPHLAEQWQRELAEKFHIEAELVLSSTIQRLERDLPLGVSVFDRHRFTIVSTDFIKTARRAEDFILKCPEFVIVDEAHGCTLAGGVGRGRQQRFDLLRRVAEDKSRHLVLVTATPHSGNEEAFRSLLSLLDEEFANLPPDLDRAEREGIRRKTRASLCSAPARPTSATTWKPIPPFRSARTRKLPTPSARNIARSSTTSSPLRGTMFPKMTAAVSAAGECGTGRRWRCCAAFLPARRRRQRHCAVAQPWIWPMTRKSTRWADARCLIRMTPTTWSQSISARARTPRAGPTRHDANCLSSRVVPRR